MSFNKTLVSQLFPSSFQLFKKVWEKYLWFVKINSKYTGYFSIVLLCYYGPGVHQTFLVYCNPALLLYVLFENFPYKWDHLYVKIDSNYEVIELPVGLFGLSIKSLSPTQWICLFFSQNNDELFSLYVYTDYNVEKLWDIHFYFVHLINSLFLSFRSIFHIDIYWDLFLFDSHFMLYLYLYIVCFFHFIVELNFKG